MSRGPTARHPAGGTPLEVAVAEAASGHPCWVMPVLVGGPYGRVAAEEAVMAQRSSGLASATGPAAAPGEPGLFWSVTCPLWLFTRSSRRSGRWSGSG
jgi:hypothetical protein